MEVVEERLTLAMTMPLRALVDADVAVRPSASLVSSWDLSAEDRTFLLEWGLPGDGLMTVRYQVEREPVLVPNVAGDLERRWVAGFERLYDLGLWGAHDLTPHIGVVAGIGTVLAVREQPMKPADLPPQLREVYPDLYHPAVEFLGSSLRQFVELTWRWRAAVRLLRELPSPSYTDTPAAVDAYFARLETCHEIVLGRMTRVDGRIDSRDENSLWVQLVLDMVP